MLYTYSQLLEMAKPYLANKDEIIGCEDGNFFDCSKEHHANNHIKNLGIKSYKFSNKVISESVTTESKNENNEDLTPIRKTIKKS